MPKIVSEMDAAVSAAPFSITLDDYKAMLLAQPRNRVQGWKAHAILWGAAFLNMAASVVFISLDGNLFGYAWLSYVNGFLGVGLLVVSYVIRPLVLRRHYNAAALGEYKYHWSADANGMRSEREGIRSEIAWNKLVHVTDDDTYFFFWINKLQAVILPKHALNSTADAETIRTFLANTGVKTDE